MGNPEVSIVIPVYNAQAYLCNCIESIENQSFKDYEIILIDDGSTDRSGSICDEYSDKQEHIRVIHKTNAGVSAARNTGIENAKGDWIYFCDADDELKPEGLDIFMKHISTDVDLIATSFERVSDSIPSSIKELAQETVFSPQSYAHALFSGINGDYQGYLWSKIFRTSIIKNNRILFDPNITHNEDRLFILKYLLNAKGTVVYTPEPTYRYFIRNSGAMRSLESPENYWKFRTDLKAFIDMRNVACAWHDSLLNNQINYGIYDSGRKNKILIRNYSKKASEERKEINRMVIEAIGRFGYYNLMFNNVVKTIIKILKR